jgi:hypothetical protein
MNRPSILIAALLLASLGFAGCQRGASADGGATAMSAEPVPDTPVATPSSIVPTDYGTSDAVKKGEQSSSPTLVAVDAGASGKVPMTAASTVVKAPATPALSAAATAARAEK